MRPAKRKVAVGTCVFLLAAGVSTRAADPPLEPVTVCEVFKDPRAYEGRPILVIGRYSFRRNGRFLGQDGCGAAAAGEKPRPASFGLGDDEKSGPKVPQVLQIDAKAVETKLEFIKRSTALGRFRFGSAEYDRWAAVYGQLEKRPVAAETSAKTGEPDPPARLLIRGDGAIIFLGEE